MSSTITPEERAEWREECAPIGGYQTDADIFILRLLNALGAVEVRAQEAESRLGRALQVESTTDKDAAYYHTWALEIRDRAEKTEALYEKMALRAAEAEADRDWIADKLANVSDKMNRIDSPETDVCKACGICTDEFVQTHENEGYGCYHAILDAAAEARRKGEES